MNRDTRIVARKHTIRHRQAHRKNCDKTTANSKNNDSAAKRTTRHYLSDWFLYRPHSTSAGLFRHKGCHTDATDKPYNHRQTFYKRPLFYRGSNNISAKNLLSATYHEFFHHWFLPLLPRNKPLVPGKAVPEANGCPDESIPPNLYRHSPPRPERQKSAKSGRMRKQLPSGHLPLTTSEKLPYHRHDRLHIVADRRKPYYTKPLSAGRNLFWIL